MEKIYELKERLTAHQTAAAKLWNTLDSIQGDEITLDDYRNIMNNAGDFLDDDFTDKFFEWESETERILHRQYVGS